jgi:DNA-binding MarR family transcriptional regulator
VARSSKAGSELEFLTALEDGEVITQMSLSRRIGVAVGLVNAWLKRSMSKGYVKARQAPYKRYAYYLTPKGFAEKSRLVAEYLESSLHLFRRARAEYADLFERAKRDGKKRIVVVGSGELLEIAVLTALAENAPLVAVHDPNTNKSHRLGIKVIQSLDEVDGVDTVILAETREPQQAYERLIKILPKEKVLVPDLLRITRNREALLVAAGLEVSKS